MGCHLSEPCRSFEAALPHDVSEQPPAAEDVRAFYEQAVSSWNCSWEPQEGAQGPCGPGHQSHDLGPSWRGTLLREHLERMAEQLLIGDLGPEELARIYDAIGKDAEGSVGLQEFVDAVQSGPVSLTLRGFVWKLRAGYNFGFSVPSSYDYSRSTNENYRSKTWDFVGEFAELRQSRNYSLHVNYVPERQRWQDKAIKSITGRVKRQSAPWLVFTCGPMGVGKGYALSWMSRHGFFPLENIVHVDPDGFKLMMPEWPQYVEQDRELAGTMCHRESCFMLEIAQRVAMQRRQNLWVDSSLRNAEHYAGEIEDIRQRFPHYRISIFYVEAQEATIRARIRQRAEKTGREVPEHLIVDSLRAMDHSLSMLTPLCDFVARINNEGPVPVLKAFESINTSGCWNIIKDRFAHTRHDDACGFPQALPPLPFVTLLEEHTALLRVRDSGAGGLVLLLGDDSGAAKTPDNALGPTAHCNDVSSDLGAGPGGCEQVQRKLRRLLPATVELATSPPCSVTFSDFARKLARVPEDADSFLWVYPHPDTARGRRLHRERLPRHGFSALEQVDPLVQLLRRGGFCYVSESGDVTAINVVSHKTELSVLQFDEPSDLPPKALAAIPAERFRPVSESSLQSRGARSYAWMLPGEVFGGVDVGDRHGAFVYQLEGRDAAIRFPVMRD